MYENVIYFAASRDFDDKNKIYGKFGNYRAGLERQRLSAYNTTNPSYKYVALPYNQMIMLQLGKPGQYLDNYINYNVFLKHSSRPMVDFKHVSTRNPFRKGKTDWFTLSEDAAKSIILYMEERSEIPLENIYDYVSFVQAICNCLESDITCNYSRDINATINCDLKWDIVPSCGNKIFTITPQTAICTVNENHVHNEQKHSCFIVTNSNVIAECFSHGQRTVTGAASIRLQKIFFPNEDSFEDFMHSIFGLCSSESFVRLDGFVWKAMHNKPWKYERLVSYEDFINTHFKGNPVFLKNPRRFADVIKYMETIDHNDFPFMTKDLDYIGFDNCVVNIVNHEVFDETTWDSTAAPRHNVEGSFFWNMTDTPLFDSLVQYQLGNGDVYTYFLAFIGRLFYRIKQFDNFNLVPLIKGDTGTGKSTVLKVIKRMFAPAAVGVLNSNNKVTFGLEAKHNKELLIAHEIGDRLTDRLSSDLFKQMVCGEDINIPRKNKNAIDVTWSVPMFLCSNIYLSYNDSQGSISRRLAIFKFNKYVPRKDISLDTRIIETELPKIVAKCLRAYQLLVEHIGNRSFWDVCPNYFHENIQEMSEQTDYIYMFLTLPPGNNVYGDKDVYFMKQQGAAMLLQDFKNKFMNYMRFKHPNVKYRWTSDYNSFNRLGYSIVHQHICKSCGSHATAGCCSNYSIANRSKRYVIENLVCVDKTL